MSDDQLCGMPREVWLNSLRQIRAEMWNREGLTKLGFNRIPLPDCQYYDCARMHHASRPRIASYEVRGNYRCNECAAVEENKRRLKVQEP